MSAQILMYVYKKLVRALAILDLYPTFMAGSYWFSYVD